jgi:DNA-binding response OmpR family regulator
LAKGEPLETYRIAIVEDHRSTSDAFRELLLEKWKGMVIDQFETLQDASKAIQANEYDLVISDIDLGKREDKYGGVKIAAMLQDKSTPVLIVSGIDRIRSSATRPA